MAVLDIVRLGHPALRTPAEEVAPEDVGSAALQRLIDDLVDTMRAARSVGLSAPQVGAGSQVFVYEVPDAPDFPGGPVPLTVVVNPMVHVQSGRQVYDWEGCTSVPDLRGLVPRQPEVRLHGLDRDGDTLERQATGLEARIVQHEFDHLNGVVFLDRMRDLRSLAFSAEWERYLSGEEHSEHAAVV
jgi:peptide deformylase